MPSISIPRSYPSPRRSLLLAAICALAALALVLTSTSVADPGDQAGISNIIAGRVVIQPQGDSLDFSTAEAAAASAEQLSDALGLEIGFMRRLGGGAVLLSLPESAHPNAIADILSERADIEFAEPDIWVRPLLVPNDPSYPDQWYFSEPDAGINVEGAWDLGNGFGTVIAILDTGLIPHEDLSSARVLPGYDLVEDLLHSGDNNGRDPFPVDQGGFTDWHGLKVTSVAAADTDNAVGQAGTAYGAEVLPIRFVGQNNTGTMTDLVDAIYWAAGFSLDYIPDNPHPADVINISYGGDADNCQLILRRAINRARNVGSAVVVAAHNQNRDVAGTSPANCDKAFTIAAIDREGSKADYSNFGDGIDLAAPGGEVEPLGNTSDPDGVLVASNAGVQSLGDDIYEFAEGTSLATPQVSGAAAILKALRPNLPLNDLETLLQSSARAFPTGVSEPCTTATCGAGILDAAAAVAALPSQVGPSLTGLQPTSGQRGDSVTIAGSGFGSNTGRVLFAHREAVIQSWADGQIQVEVPGGVGGAGVPVRVEHNGGDLSQALAFDYNAPLQATSLIIEGPDSVEPRSRVRYRATVTYNDGLREDVSQAVTWSVFGYGPSFHPTQLNQLQSGTAFGPDLIQAVFRYRGDGGNGITAQKRIVIYEPGPPTLIGLDIRDTNEVLEASIERFEAWAQFSDGTEEKVTGRSIWDTDCAPAGRFIARGIFRTRLVEENTLCNISATYELRGQTASQTLGITIIDLVLTEVVISGPTDVEEGGECEFQAFARFSDGSEREITRRRWTSNNEPVLNVSRGTCTVGKVDDNTDVEIGMSYRFRRVTKTDTHTITVINRVLEFVKIKKQGSEITEPDEIPESRTTTYTATAHFNFGPDEDVTALATWEFVPPPPVCHQIISGLLIACAVTADEDVTIRATYTFETQPPKHDDLNVRIKDRVLLSLKVTGPSPLIGGTSAQYTATGIFNTPPLQEDLTNLASWTVTPPHTITAGLLQTVPVLSDQDVDVTATYTYQSQPAMSDTRDPPVRILAAPTRTLTVTGPTGADPEKVYKNTTTPFHALLSTTTSAGTIVTDVTDQATWSVVARRRHAKMIEITNLTPNCTSEATPLTRGWLKAKRMLRNQTVTVRAFYTDALGTIGNGLRVNIVSQAPNLITVHGPGNLSEQTTTRYQACATFPDRSGVLVTPNARWRCSSKRCRPIGSDKGLIRTYAVSQPKPTVIRAATGGGRSIVKGLLNAQISNDK